MKINLSKIRIPKLKIRKDFVFGLFAYIHILVLIPLFFQRKDYFVQYHAKQGIALLVVWTIGMFSFYLPVAPYLFAIFIAGNVLYGIFNITLRREKSLFLIGKWAENLEI